MSLAPGSFLGAYEVLSSIGAGGMGEVYRARDTKLEREVAIKVLPPDFAEDPDRLARFRREAKVLASLNHPNIAQIYGVEDRAIIMELVVGDSLRGPVSVETALNQARQIAVALEAAHEKGIVHRDLKPANVKIRMDGVVKVLDFGLAVAPIGSAGDSNPATSPTITRATSAGLILGTAAYMSPEQACGKSADKRADVWSFGVVLWELLTGNRLFVGETVSDTLADVLRAPIDFEQLPRETPPAIVSLLRRCLDRSVKNRLRDIGEARIAIDAAASNEAESARTVVERGPLGKKLPWGIALAAGVLALSLAPFPFLYFRQKPAALLPPVRFQVPVPGDTAFEGILALSPDGSKLAFVAGGHLWVYFLESGETRNITPAQDGPFWSPDSRFIGYPFQNRLMKIESTGGSPQTVSDLHDNWGGGTWSRDDVIVFSDNSGGLSRVPASGGTPAPVTVLDSALHETSHWAPCFLPDGRNFLYNRFSYSKDSAVYVGSLDAKPEQQSAKPLATSNWGAIYAPSVGSGDGYLLVLRRRTLLSQPFDWRKLTLSGLAVPVAEQVGAPAGLGYGGFSASANGAMAFSQGSPADDQLTWSNGGDKVLGTIGEPGEYEDPALSPDGTRLAVSKATSEDRSNIWLLDLSRDMTTRLTFSPALDSDPVWSPDGTRVIFSSVRNGGRGLYLKSVSGTEEEVILKPGEAKYPTSWSRDGRFLLYQERNPRTKMDIRVVPLEGDKKPVPFLVTEFSEGDAQFSPDGRWVAYVSDESGRPEVYVRSFRPEDSTAPSKTGGNADLKVQISSGSGFQPRWRADGKELFYRSVPDGKVMAVDTVTNPQFRVGATRLIGASQQMFQGWPSPGSRWDPTPDGRRFLTLTTVAGKPKPVTVVLNWQTALKK